MGKETTNSETDSKVVTSTSESTSNSDSTAPAVFTQAQVEELIKKAQAESKKSTSDPLQTRIEHLAKKLEAIEAEKALSEKAKQEELDALKKQEEKERLEKSNLADELMKTRQDMEEIMKVSNETITKISTDADQKISLYKAEMLIKEAISKSPLPAKFLRRYMPTPDEYLSNPKILEENFSEAEAVFKEISPERAIPEKDKTTTNTSVLKTNVEDSDLFNKVYTMDADAFKKATEEVAKKYNLKM